MSVQQVLENLQIDNDKGINGRQLKASFISLFKLISTQMTQQKEENEQKQSNFVKMLQTVIKEVDGVKKTQQELQNKLGVMANILKNINGEIQAIKDTPNNTSSTSQSCINCSCVENKKEFIGLKKVVNEIKVEMNEIKQNMNSSKSDITIIAKELNSVKIGFKTNSEEMELLKKKLGSSQSINSNSTTVNPQQRHIIQPPQINNNGMCPPPPPPCILPPTSNNSEPLPSPSGRGDLLSQIQRGTKLKKASVNDRSKPVVSKAAQSPSQTHSQPTNPLIAAIAARANRGGSSMTNTRGAPTKKW